ncbi:bifunctional 6-phosphofructo-2-kinase/fructose-2,6-bisphosphate 2-phosphatase [Polychaeton citri CBS 116435]|uniref:Bifunctional 6-phosphofructo-2-kinase/fructose-2,6-bisphosphate 2-phosphatase n=1 Tax=Polychaeton citri CBS 116435 TaxID=1314669 RepID=A0A9P4PWX5_9PEZI|nr:bifunctional 6-phosphofructo-2-kinase/fructose-2,6-bisphosphate 2-phosphatase [Polychaeton citri CBS 116435]
MSPSSIDLARTRSPSEHSAPNSVDVKDLRSQLGQTLLHDDDDSDDSSRTPDGLIKDYQYPRPAPQPQKKSSLAAALNGQLPDTHAPPPGSGASMAMNDTPATTAPSSPRMYGNSPSRHSEILTDLKFSLPLRQGSGTSTPRVRPTTLDIPGLTKSKVSPDGKIAQRDVGAKLVIVMVGLPARGKSYITKKLARYMNWLQHDTTIFNVGSRRRVVAGGPNSLEKTKSQQVREQRVLEAHRPSMVGLPGIVNHRKSSLMAVDAQKPASVAHIMLNGDRVEPPGTPPRRPSVSHPSDKEVNNGEDDDKQNGATMQEQNGSSLHKMPTQMPDTEAMEQNASFFDPNNKQAALIREQVALETLDELLDYILDQNGSVGILDATNSTLERRKMIMKHIRERAGPELNVLFLESSCLDPDLLEANIRLKLNGPDYKDKDPHEALDDFKKRILEYEKAYVPLGAYEEKHNMPYIQMIDVGRKVISHQIRGFLSAQANYYLLNFNLAPRQIWITRHGLSEDNVSGKIGGDSNLAEEGVEYAESLALFMNQKRLEWDEKQIEDAKRTHFPPQPGDATPPNPYYSPTASSHSTASDEASNLSTEEIPGYEPKAFCVWTSMLKRSIQTAQFFNDEDYDIKQMRMLDELNAGVMEGLTYNCISSQFPDEYRSRKTDKLHYRYPGPGGEGYLDVINRLRPVIVELERMTDHVLLVGHRSIARVLLAYFRGLKREEVADLDVPLGMLYCLEPKPYGVDFKAYKWDKDTRWFHEVPDFELKRAEHDMI